MAKAKPKEAEAEVEEDETEGAAIVDDGDSLVVNLSGVDEQGDFEVIPRGIYPAVVSDVQFGHSQSSGNPMWTWILEISDGEHEGTKLYSYTVFNEKGLARAKRTINRVAPELLEGPFSPEQVALDGILLDKPCQIRVDIRPYEGQKRNNVRDILPPADGQEGGDGFL